MASKNLNLDESLTAAARVVARANPRHRSLSGLVENLLIAHLRSNTERARRICQKTGVPFPAEILAK